MQRDSWTIIMVSSGGPGIIGDDVRAALVAAAYNLHVQQCERMRIDSEVCDGIIQTNRDTCTVGSLSGVLFRAQIDTEAGGWLVEFLLHKKDLKRAAEILRRQELFELSDPRNSSVH